LPLLALPSIVRVRPASRGELFIGLWAGLALSACSPPSRGPRPSEPPSADGGIETTTHMERALALLDGGAPLGPRADALALAESIESAAVREGTGERATALHVLAAELLERVYRI
jgi:hypothetical protein